MDRDRKIRLTGPSGPPPRGMHEEPMDDIGRALQDLDRSAAVLDRNQLPQRVKVITPQVIAQIVHSIVDRFADGASKDELVQLAAEQTQLQLRYEQLQNKLGQQQEENQNLQAALLEARHSQGQVDQYAQHYQQQIADLQQRNAAAVDMVADLQQKLDEAEAAHDHTLGELVQLRDQLGERDAEMENLRGQLESDHEGAEHFAEELGTEMEELRVQNDDLSRLNEDLTARLEQLEGMDAEHQEALNQERRSRVDAENELDAANGRITALEEELRRAKEDGASRGAMENLEAELEQLRANEGQWIEEKRKMAAQISNETEMRRQLEEKLSGLESGEVLSEAAKEQEAKRKTELEQAVEAKAEAEKERDRLKEDLAKAESGSKKARDAEKELSTLRRKFENIETELESLRASEGEWLEQKRRLASQLSNETNLRREAEAKLKAAEVGEMVPAAKHESLRKEHDELKKKLKELEAKGDG